MDELQRILLKQDKQALVGFQFRFHPGLQQVKRLLEEGAIGRPFSVRAHWGEYLPGWHPWEDYRQGYSARPDLGGGVVLTLCHLRCCVPSSAQDEDKAERTDKQCSGVTNELV